jgi:transcriptional regulator with XRE-family HTH domain
MARTDEQIRRARRESGFSQEALAERIGVAPAELHRYEEGAQVSSRHLELIAVATGKPLSFFLDGTGLGSRNGRGITGALRAALAWLSAPAAADTDADALLAEVAARQRSLAERERRLVDRERRLTEKAPPPRVSADEPSRALEERERVLAAREAELREREEALERRRKAVEERERKLDEQSAMTPPEPEATQEAATPAAESFNLDALEHALDERAAEFPERADEWRAYMAFLREFVHADGNLPPTFNSLVREVFRELL